MKRKVSFLPKFNGFGLKDSEFQKIVRHDIFPSFELGKDDYAKLGVPLPSKDAPVVALLFGREDGYYCSDWNYIKMLAEQGVRIIFLDFEYCRTQLADCDALVLPGGAFASPERFYTDAKNNRMVYPSKRSQAYIECILDALKYKMPILGICAGAQMVAGVVGMKLFRSAEYFETPLQHKTSEVNAHRVFLVKDTPFAELMGKPQSISVNSRHREFLAPERVQRETLALCDGDKLPLDIYATATDGIPEAWGDMENGILCVQWHPEDMGEAGVAPYRWIAEQAALHQ